MFTHLLIHVLVQTWEPLPMTAFVRKGRAWTSCTYFSSHVSWGAQYVSSGVVPTPTELRKERPRLLAPGVPAPLLGVGPTGNGWIGLYIYIYHVWLFSITFYNYILYDYVWLFYKSITISILYIWYVGLVHGLRHQLYVLRTCIVCATSSRLSRCCPSETTWRAPKKSMWPVAFLVPVGSFDSALIQS